MAFRITLSNAGGELASSTVDTPRQAALALIDMLNEVRELHADDTITVTEQDE